MVFGVLGHAATLFDDLDALASDVGRQRRTLERHRRPRAALRPADSARLERSRRIGFGGRVDVLGDVEGVALAVTEAVDDGHAQALIPRHALQ